MNLEDFRAKQSIDINIAPEALYDMVSDVTRTGEWSPVVQSASLKGGEKVAVVGSIILGHNVNPSRIWDTESVVTVADRPREFTWEVSGGVARWGYTIEPNGEGSTLTEHWQLTEYGVEFFKKKWGDQWEAQLEDRRQAALAGIPATLKAIKEIAEAE
ncbi:MAG: SRPBCC family protein [Corynebacterium sp.]|nr:SRPBCC family protein [Corynebacterium sp.]